MAGIRAAVAAALLASACGGPSPGTEVAPKATQAPPAAVAANVPPASPERPPDAAAGPGALPPVAVPGAALYACVVEGHGERQVSAIELAPKVAALCTANPELGPCQYAREACRAGGGRVFAANGQEITRATEAEYDRRVLRVRLKSN